MWRPAFSSDARFRCVDNFYSGTTCEATWHAHFSINRVQHCSMFYSACIVLFLSFFAECPSSSTPADPSTVDNICRKRRHDALPVNIETHPDTGTVRTHGCTVLVCIRILGWGDFEFVYISSEFLITRCVRFEITSLFLGALTPCYYRIVIFLNWLFTLIIGCAGTEAHGSFTSTSACGNVQARCTNICSGHAHMTNVSPLVHAQTSPTIDVLAYMKLLLREATWYFMDDICNFLKFTMEQHFSKRYFYSDLEFLVLTLCMWPTCQDQLLHCREFICMPMRKL